MVSRSITIVLLFAGAVGGGLPHYAARADEEGAPPPAKAPQIARQITEQDLTFFEKKIRPVLVDSCYECHSAQSKTLHGGLRVDTPRGLLDGGDSGPAVVPGKPDDSLILGALRHESFEMPPTGKLPAAVIADFASWIEMGAQDPRQDDARNGNSQIDYQRASQHWAFQPSRAPPLPAVADKDWAENEIDRFLLAAMEDRGVGPAPPADKRTLIRRVTFDLTGLPPTPEEVADFVADESPDAYSRLVDRLLASPHYGQRWGRHWLDVARYADSNGMDVNHAYAHAWRYRDYVIGAFNQDKPFDRFVVEQLAGDLLMIDNRIKRNDAVTATGFLSIGPKVLAEIDAEKKRMDIIDEQLDTIGRALLAMTIGCARCHDHKFDPIPTADYYAMAGVLKSTRTMEHFNRVATWHERELALPRDPAEETARVQRLQQWRAELASLLVDRDDTQISRERKRAADYLLAATLRMPEPIELSGLKSIANGSDAADRDDLILIEAESFNRGNVRIDTDDLGAGIGVIRTKRDYPDYVEWQIEIAKSGRHQLEFSYASEESRPVRVLLNDRLVRAAAGGTITGSWRPDGQVWHAEGIFEFQSGVNTLRIEREGPIPILDQLALSPTDAQSTPLPEPGEPVASLAERMKLDAGLLQRWEKLLLEAKRSDGHAAREWFKYTSEREPAKLRRAAEQFVAEERVAEWIADTRRGPFATESAVAGLPPQAAARVTQLQELIEAEETTAASATLTVMAVEEGDPVNQPLLVRGNHLAPGMLQPRHFLRAIEGGGKAVPENRSGRLEMARWIVAAENPLTARVIVNRVWHWHFGRGLVATPDNFGAQGATPTHPQLLDWLANRFVESGWSIKSLHRLICHCSAYRMSSRYNAAAAEVDPDNQLYWRYKPRRLEVEAIRDAMLAVAGRLDYTMGGSPMPFENRQYVTGGSAPKDIHQKLTELYNSNRRTVYLPVIRNAPPPMLETFDFPNADTLTGRRDSTTVAPQALFMLNSRFVATQAAALAQRIIKAESETPARIREAYERALSRPPTDAELELATAFLSDAARLTESDAQVWEAFCQMILSSNDFLYLK